MMIKFAQLISNGDLPLVVALLMPSSVVVIVVGGEVPFLRVCNFACNPEIAVAMSTYCRLHSSTLHSAA